MRSDENTSTPGGASAPPDSSVVRLEIVVFTDPLCCWSWALEPQLRRLRYAYAGRIAWRTVMGAMIEDWTRFEDPLNSVHRPSQMGPLWIQAREMSGMPIDPDLWVRDPPASSLPACRAVKAAQMQGPVAGDRLLRRLREAVMIEGCNIAREEAIRQVASRLAADCPDLFDLGRFDEDLAAPASQKALEEDVKEARFRRIGRFPTLVLRTPDGPPHILVGWRPYAALAAAVQGAAPHLGPPRELPDPESYATYWGGLLDRERQEAVNPAGAPDIGLSGANPSSWSSAAENPVR